MGKRGQTRNCNTVAEVPDKRDDNGGLIKKKGGLAASLKTWKDTADSCLLPFINMKKHSRGGANFSLHFQMTSKKRKRKKKKKGVGRRQEEEQSVRLTGGLR